MAGEAVFGASLKKKKNKTASASLGRNMNGFIENGTLKLEKSRRIQYENERERAC